MAIARRSDRAVVFAGTGSVTLMRTAETTPSRAPPPPMRNNAFDGSSLRAAPSLRPSVLSTRPGRNRARRALGPGLARRDADRLGQVDRLSASGHPVVGPDPRRLASHRLD